MPLNSLHLQALQYVRNTNGGAHLRHFVEDFEPIGHQLWDELRSRRSSDLVAFESVPPGSLPFLQ